MIKNIRKILLLVFGICCLHISKGQVNNMPVGPQDWLIKKNYYASYLLLKDPVLIQELMGSKPIAQVLEKRFERFNKSASCSDLMCYLNAFKWQDNEIDLLAEQLAEQIGHNKKLDQLVQASLIPSMTYGVLHHETAKAYFTKALKQDLKAMNYVVDVYGGGKSPNYPKIDSISFDVKRAAYLHLLDDVRQDVRKDIPTHKTAFFLTMMTAVRLLEINERWDAAQLEPLIELENKKAYEAVKNTDFASYPYSLLLTLGAGPEVYGQPISPGGMLRARMAARSYFEKLAPFIVLSGGKVHPYKTRFIEAIEMKKYLIEIMGVPEAAILIDPHARHTTTNLRNTARILLNYGFPKDKYAIVNSSKVHIDAVEKMGDRCIRELGYIPYTLGKRISDVIIEFKAKEEAYTIDPDEPLDP
ncbi:YdcF family protein [Sphingobacterium siyangense]|uniref:YdcF family protein n=1 Tax=Sphingobacterium siyangense TaxID=459529 RepID=UPI003C71B28A